VPPRFNQVLRTAREQKGLTQMALAKRAGITQSYLAGLEGGRRRNPSLAVLKRLAKVLRVPVGELLK
jgi:transcriptional regulator with XRE-family HTH domain